jgi:hypothetical protein
MTALQPLHDNAAECLPSGGNGGGEKLVPFGNQPGFVFEFTSIHRQGPSQS